MRRLLVPIVERRRYWEAVTVTPRFLLSAPAWMGATTYLAALTGSALFGAGALLASQLRLLLHGRSYLESLLAPASAAPLVGALHGFACALRHVCLHHSQNHYV